MKPQKTIKSECKISGKGLFSGMDCKVVFKPAAENAGVVFVRTDLEEPVRIEAICSNIAERPRRTALQKGDVFIETVEHCLAAVKGLEIDNLTIEIDSYELPAGDCSAQEFLKVLKKAGVEEQSVPRKEFVIEEPISIAVDGASIYALPYEDDDLNITYDLDYGMHTGVGRQLYSCKLNSDQFERNLAPARTFLLEAEAIQLQAKGIGTHLGPRDILVLNSDGPIKNSLRFSNECARHKVVDLIGDISLVGRSIKGRIVAYKSGHNLNQAMARRLFEAAVRQERINKSGTDALLDIRRIQRILPHRYPFLLVDKVVEIEGNQKIRGIKNVTFNELFFQGHFPGTPIMPGVLIVEALAQVSGLLFAQRLEHTGKLAVLLGMNEVKLRKAVVPGDQLVLESEAVKLRRRTAVCKCRAMVRGNLAAEAEIMFMLVDDEQI